MPGKTSTAARPHVRARHGVAELAQAHTHNHEWNRPRAGSPVALIAATMTRDQFEAWCRMFAGSTVGELRFMRDVPRAYIALRVVQRIEREQTQTLLRAS
jgi:hypothetical protein